MAFICKVKPLDCAFPGAISFVIQSCSIEVNLQIYFMVVIIDKTVGQKFLHSGQSAQETDSEWSVE